jgi:phage protein D
MKVGAQHDSANPQGGALPESAQIKADIQSCSAAPNKSSHGSAINARPVERHGSVVNRPQSHAHSVQTQGIEAHSTRADDAIAQKQQDRGLGTNDLRERLVLEVAERALGGDTSLLRDILARLDTEAEKAAQEEAKARARRPRRSREELWRMATAGMTKETVLRLAGFTKDSADTDIAHSNTKDTGSGNGTAK